MCAARDRQAPPTSAPSWPPAAPSAAPPVDARALPPLMAGRWRGDGSTAPAPCARDCGDDAASGAGRPSTDARSFETRPPAAALTGRLAAASRGVRVRASCADVAAAVSGSAGPLSPAASAGAVPSDGAVPPVDTRAEPPLMRGAEAAVVASVVVRRLPLAARGAESSPSAADPSVFSLRSLGMAPVMLRRELSSGAVRGLACGGTRPLAAVPFAPSA
jgi:hypothetical protein